jgi:hypothetical protein
MTTHEKLRELDWATADGRRIPIKDLETSHLVNVINWIIDNKNLYPVHVLDIMTNEAEYRKTLLFAEGKAYPQKVNRRWQLIDPSTGKGHIVPPPAEYIEAVKDNAGYQAMSKRTQKKRQTERK